MIPMLRSHTLALLLFAALAVAMAGGGASLAEEAAAPGTPGLLRYIGRDHATGLPTAVDDRSIVAHEAAVERYGKDEQEPEPPPPSQGLDIGTVVIPRLGAAAPSARLGLDRFGRLDVPADTRTVSWHPAYTSLPGEGGSTFMAAHFEYRGIPGVFFRLSTMQPGDEVTIVLSDGSRHLYRVTSTVDYALGVIDMGALLKGREGMESLVLMTCSGPANEGEYAFRTVVLAERVSP